MHSKTLRIGLLCCLLALPAVAEQHWRSPVQQATLVELYTSEGCSSCPPADRWFSGLLDHPDLWSGVFPVAFHVDYWNYLGWEDRFASADHSRRQRTYRREGRTRGVYTPGMQAAGWEWRDWRRGAPVPSTDQETGELWLQIEGSRFRAGFVPVKDLTKNLDLDDAELHVALVGTGLRTQVRSGENRGRLLAHDFVVLSHRIYSGEALSWSGDVPTMDAELMPERRALIAWVSPGDRQDPLQVVGGWLAP